MNGIVYVGGRPDIDETYNVYAKAVSRVAKEELVASRDNPYVAGLLYPGSCCTPEASASPHDAGVTSF